MYLRYRVKNKPVNGNTGMIFSTEDQLKRTLRLHFEHHPIRSVQLKYRVERLWLNQMPNSEKGLLAYVESSFDPLPKISGDMRLQYYLTDSYASRIYAYESDLMYGYSIPGFYDQGFRYYANLRFDPIRLLSVGLKWSQTICSNKTSLGSGLNTIHGKKRSEVKLQILMKF
jgi:hypothetical protein